jgi:xylose isomerase
MNRGDEMLGWDTDQFPHDAQQVALALYHVLRGGGIGAGGLNFDAKLRRQSIDPDDLVWAHATAMDICARALLIAEKMVQDGALQRHVEERYAGWRGERGRAILDGRLSLEELAADAERRGLDPQPRSGRQERLEHLVASYV